MTGKSRTEHKINRVSQHTLTLPFFSGKVAVMVVAAGAAAAA